jgi:hypothetical protein
MLTNLFDKGKIGIPCPGTEPPVLLSNDHSCSVYLPDLLRARRETLAAPK